MKANELMIGDLVMFPNSIEKVQEISYVCGKGYCASFAASATLFPISIDKIKPIPLTPEILEKNGFVKVFSEYWCMDEWKCRSIGTAWVDYENCIRMEIETNGVHITMPIHYIHELQHTLKLCGIEKTIEL